MLLTRKLYAELVCTQCSKHHEVRVHYEAWAYAHFAYQSYYRQLRHLLRPCTLSHSGHADVENLYVLRAMQLFLYYIKRVRVYSDVQPLWPQTWLQLDCCAAVCFG
jgi:hypothetical protein